MDRLDFVFGHKDYSDEALNGSILEVLASNILCSIASVKDGQVAYVHTAYFCFNGKLEMFFLSSPEAQHSLNVAQNQSVAVAIYDSHQPWTNGQHGLQLFGKCHRVSATKLIEATSLYLRRFVGLSEWIKHPADFAKGAIESRPYIVQVESIKLYDSRRFGDDNFISLRVAH